MGEDAPQVPIDPLEFILAPLSMTDAKYQLWRSGILYTQRVSKERDYDEFNNTRLMPSLTPTVYSLSLSLSHLPFLFVLLRIMTLLAYRGQSMSMVLMVSLVSVLEMTKYSWKIYGPRGFAYPGDDDDDDRGGGGDGGGNSKVTPSYQPRKRHFQ